MNPTRRDQLLKLANQLWLAQLPSKPFASCLAEAERRLDGESLAGAKPTTPAAALR